MCRTFPEQDCAKDINYPSADLLNDFVVITVVSNPCRYKSRYKLYRDFEKMVQAARVKMITVEIAFGGRRFEVTEEDNRMHVQLRSIDELWHKENMINLGIEHCLQEFPHTKKIAWVDADVAPMQSNVRNWFEETWHQLEHYQVVQMFEWAQDLDPENSPIGQAHLGFMAAYVKGGYQRPDRGGFFKHGGYTKHGHPGYAWAANVSALNDLGGVFDKAILGSGDAHMCLAFIGCAEQTIHSEMHPAYKEIILNWEQRATRYIKRDVGFVPGAIFHHWHGRKRHRGYVDRWKILTGNQFNPHTDIKRDAQGLYQLETFDDRQIMLRDQIRSYFRSRNEDSIDVD